MEFKEIILDDLVEFYVDNRGKTCPVVEKEYSFLPLIATNCITDDLHPRFDKIRYVDKQTYQKWFRSHPVENDILFVNKGTPGGTALVPKDVDFCIAQDMVALRIKKEYDFSYVFAALRSKLVKQRIESMHVGTMIPHFKKGDFKLLTIPVPNIKNQEKIGRAHLNLLVKIDVNKQIIKNHEQIARTLFKRWFIDFEFPNEDGEPYRSSGGKMWESELGEIPEGWKVITIKDVCDANKRSLTKKDNWSYINYLDTSNITKNSIEDIQFIDATKDKVPSRAKRKVQTNDVVYSTVRPNQQHYGIIKEPIENMVVSTGFTVLSSKGKYSNDLIYLWLTQKEVISNLQAIAEQSTSAYPSIKADDILSLKILLPSQRELDMISRIIDLQNKLIWNKQQENKKLSELRDTLLPKLLSGEIEIPAESEVLEHV
ncbi:restriction endonuclease subunit S [Metabacillus sp. cB07]|uniref:restriction endonuclease subunit S n=1 Tax=Metabacillus sp. cB07 TaxID=2806989 RepID=UPI00193A045E|nr:restriction endonuclease subunit S [Metabacillus sp. cB07]